MDIKLTHKGIKEICGTVSFKRGDAFFRNSKVRFNEYNADRCVATVSAAEDFYVTVEKDSGSSFQTSCSCPKLASFDKECQHVAAVLLAIYKLQQKGTPVINSSEEEMAASPENSLTDGFLTLFSDSPVRSSGHQLHFENRNVLETEFTCQPVHLGKGQYLFTIKLKIGPALVLDIRDFLQSVKEGKPCVVSLTFTYDSNLYCFKPESDAVIQQLIQVIHDESVYVNALLDEFDYIASKDMLLIPPSSWERLKPSLAHAEKVKLKVAGKTFDRFHFSDESLPLRFELSEADRKCYLRIKGLDPLLVLNSYNSVLLGGKIITLKKENCQRLYDLTQMIEATGENMIPIAAEQMELFLEKVVPGLRKLGEVQISEEMAKQFLKTPLVAKLYLDRLKNRLLAGLEFHYENIVINPLERREPRGGARIIRDVEKEDEILQLMEESSFARTEGGYFLQNEELEYEFLYHVVPKLQKLLQIYATTAVRNRIFRENAKPRIRIRMKKERTNWLEFKFEMTGIADQEIRDILYALEEKRKYYRLRNGSLLSLEAKEFEEIQRFLNAVPVQAEELESGLDMPIVQGLRMVDTVGEQGTFRQEESFREFLATLENPDSLQIEVPESLDTVLRDYQKHGYKWMKTLAHYGFGGILADDMGLGKTLQTIAFIRSELPDIRDKKVPALIVCPSSLTYNWLSELMKFAPEIQAVVVDGNQFERAELQKNLTGIDVVITSYPLLLKDFKWYEIQDFHTVFFDEAQAFKNPVTQTARAVKKIQAKHRFALTGTPVENSPEELWSIFHVVFPELFQGLKDYSNLTRKSIARRIRPFLLRRMKEDVLSELPEKMESIDSVELLPEQKKLYAAYLAKLREDTLKHLNKDTIRKNRIKILAGLTRLRQICCHPALFVDGYKGSSAKFEQLKRIIEESRLSGRRVLIFSQFTKMLNLIGRELALEGLPFFYLDGQTPSEERVEVCRRYNEGERDFFLISLKAGGTGLNLTGADTVILYDLWWNPAVEEQAADRAHRMGQTNTVQVIKLLARGTIEEKMNELQDKKKNLIEEIIDSDEKAAKSLSEEDIREILMI
ncbi:SNF2 family DNA or RNA helicase [Cytobacillus oceanisediminis]|uniref:SNF2 family DNA or RNA helicase n=1 Tax=Cytobacillus oceanisediminis TaxID=665099 RepID=A0A2V2ZX96_9BACI|nr:DEAD/DEAH box helicase [Cytobacillus oceanisediminis]PWW28310.1 SNF2 family DNA or RNA helicase [Cytobacillus oceanisediminis]